MAKIEKVAQENKKAQKKPKQPVAAGDARLCVPASTAVPPSPWAMVKTTGSQWWSLVLPFSQCCILVLLFGLQVFPWIFRLGFNGPLLQPSLIHSASTSSFFPITWLDICKSKIKNPEQAKTSVIGEIGT